MSCFIFYLFNMSLLHLQVQATADCKPASNLSQATFHVHSEEPYLQTLLKTALSWWRRAIAAWTKGKTTWNKGMQNHPLVILNKNDFIYLSGKWHFYNLKTAGHATHCWHLRKQNQINKKIIIFISGSETTFILRNIRRQYWQVMH